ncbi:MAG: TonB-dependent receptor, partial [Nitrospiria bacterium]
RFRDDDPAGERIPNAIEGVVTAGVSVDNLGGPFGSLRMRYFGPRALVEDNSARSEPSTLVNGQVGYQLVDRLKLTVEVFNIFNADVNDIDYFYESQLQGESAPVSDFHIHPAEPRSARVSLVYNF